MVEPKNPNQSIEDLKIAARIEETFPDTDQCPACQEARHRTGDPTYLCDAHLRRVYGL